MSENYFLQVIQLLREQEEILLYNNILKISDEDAQGVVDFLKEEYERESLAYPHQAPGYNASAALWGAKTIYLAAQLLLYRKDEVKDLENIFLPFGEAINGSAILSADLCLRFLPGIIGKLKEIDDEDELIKILEAILEKWHYSGIQRRSENEELDFAEIISDACLLQLYCNRVLVFKNKKLANHPVLKEQITANLGMYAAELGSGLIEN